jgi:hypothetical protein
MVIWPCCVDGEQAPSGPANTRRNSVLANYPGPFAMAEPGLSLRRFEEVDEQGGRRFQRTRAAYEEWRVLRCAWFWSAD